MCLPSTHRRAHTQQTHKSTLKCEKKIERTQFVEHLDLIKEMSFKCLNTCTRTYMSTLGVQTHEHISTCGVL